MPPITLVVDWDKSTYSAGDSVQCIISLQNTNTSPPTPNRASARQTKLVSNRRRLWRSKLANQSTSTTGNQLNSLHAEQGRSRQASAASHGSNQPSVDSLPRNGNLVLRSSGLIGRKVLPRSSTYQHGRSVSIISVTPSELSNSPARSSTVKTDGRSHVRAISLQNVPRTRRRELLPINSSHTEGGSLHSSKKQLKQQGTVHEVERSLSTHDRLSMQPGSSAQSNTSLVDGIPTIGEPPIDENIPEWSLPGSSRTDHRNRNALPAATVHSTPRSSLDVISQSNRSTETLVSDYNASTTVPGGTSRIPEKICPVNSIGTRAHTETLMMGYAQLTGYFTLDGSLVNPAPFESVKKKGAIGAKGGGGVVGVESTTRDTGLLGSLGLSNLGRSLSGIVGTKEPSTIREMRGVANAKAVPIISTPQSVLFVDLTLGSGEIRKFRYSYPLPQGLPPSFKGRAIKVNYHLTVGVQRSTSTLASHILHHVDIPFRVLPGEIGDSRKIPLYDLKSPYIILEHPIETLTLDEANQDRWYDSGRHREAQKSLKNALSSYVSSLLINMNQTPSQPALPSDATYSRPRKSTGLSDRMVRGLASEHRPIQASQSPNARQDGTRFDIHRSRRRIAAVVLTRSTYRLGDVVLAAVDFRGAQIPCYSLHASLESIEEVDESVALRSPASVARATRKIQASEVETTVCARRVLLQFELPASATPSFETSGVRLKWYMRFEFTTRHQSHDHVDAPLLEKAAADERGDIVAAAQELIADAFEVTIPIQVRGASLTGKKIHSHSSFPL